MRRRTAWAAALLALGAGVGTAAAQGINPAAISRGYSGFGFSAAAGAVGRGAARSGLRYLVVPGVCFPPASVYAPGPPLVITSPAAREQPRFPRATVTFLVPESADLYVDADGPYPSSRGFARTYYLYPRQKDGVSLPVLARWL